MYLYILAGGKVQVAAAVLVRYIGNLQYLFKSDLTERKFNTHHLYAGLALAVNTACKAQAPEFFIVYLSFPEQAYFAFKVDNVFFNNGILQFCSEALHSDGGYILLKKPLLLGLEEAYIIMIIYYSPRLLPAIQQ
jgi:hypothetical protein